jgi:hypothetical protein
LWELQLKAFAAGMIGLANVILGVTLVTPIFGSGALSPSAVMAVGAAVAVVLYAGALDVLSGVGDAAGIP